MPTRDGCYGTGDRLHNASDSQKSQDVPRLLADMKAPTILSSSEVLISAENRLQVASV